MLFSSRYILLIYPFRSNQNAAGGKQGANKTQKINQQVEEVVGIMQENIDKVMEKQERLETLNDKAG